ncbi:RING finger protein 222-like [Arapaima gigas]
MRNRRNPGRDMEAECDPRELECPVCYEVLQGAERTLSCGHVFCHDCLVKTLVSASRGARTLVGDSIVCPVCRHVTFIKGATTSKEPGIVQTLEVPVCTAGGSPSASTPVASERDPASSLFSRICWALRRISRVSIGLTAPQPSATQNHDSQIFIISNMGRPMSEEDRARSSASEPTARPRRRMSACTTARFLVMVLLLFSVLALIAATLPWVLLS